MQNLLENHDFQPEIVGGGSFMLSRYMESGAYIWITGSCGDGLPDQNDWLVVAYPADFDGDYSTVVFEASSEQYGDIPLIDVVAAAIDNLQFVWSEHDTCRNGRPIDECDCC